VSFSCFEQLGPRPPLAQFAAGAEKDLVSTEWLFSFFCIFFSGTGW